LALCIREWEFFLDQKNKPGTFQSVGFFNFRQSFSVINQNIIFSSLRVFYKNVTLQRKLFLETNFLTSPAMISFYVIMFILPVLIIAATIFLATRKSKSHG